MTRLVVAVGLTAAGIGMTGAGCVSSETTPPEDPPPPYPFVSDFCAKLAELVCIDDVVRACYGSDDASLEQDKQACVSAFMTSSRCNPNIDYHHEGAEPCLAAWQEVYADAAVTADELEDAEEICLDAFYDPVGVVNSECSYDYECDVSQDLRCVIKPGAVTGTCQVPIRVGAGHQCGAIDQYCEDGFYCDEASGACLARKRVGEACSSTILCVESALCSMPVDGVCEAKLPNNSPCSADIQCERGLCNKGSGDEEGVCAGNIPLYQNGAVCDDFK